MKARILKHKLHFKQPSGTSRGVLHDKQTWFLILENESSVGVGECSMLKGLSIDDRPDYEQKLQWVCDNIHLGEKSLYAELSEFPSIQFGVEMAFRSLISQDPFQLFPSTFTQGKSSIPINGLVWMGTKEFMNQQIKEKIENGFGCIKLKIGAIDFETECQILQSIRDNFSAAEIEIRVDANGAFSSPQALEKLKRLSDFTIHSIEQPIAVNQWDAMAALCEQSPIDIALDEELIGVLSTSKRMKLLETIQPHYLILKPSLIGGWQGSESWIEAAQHHNIAWWATSALESNIGLNAIAQWVFLKQNPLKQGLGTGALYTNNIEAPLEVQKGYLSYNQQSQWDFKLNASCL
jgi:o-succinylbenzoate synthase